jgi:hypothetical protein
VLVCRAIQQKSMNGRADVVPFICGSSGRGHDCSGLGKRFVGMAPKFSPAYEHLRRMEERIQQQRE